MTLNMSIANSILAINLKIVVSRIVVNLWIFLNSILYVKPFIGEEFAESNEIYIYKLNTYWAFCKKDMEGMYETDWKKIQPFSCNLLKTGRVPTYLSVTFNLTNLLSQNLVGYMSSEVRKGASHPCELLFTKI